MYEKMRAQSGERVYEPSLQGPDESLVKFHALYDDWFRIEQNRQRKAEDIQNVECPFQPRTNKSNERFRSTAAPFMVRLEKDLQDRFVKKERILHEKQRQENRDKGTGQLFFRPKVSAKAANVPQTA